MESSPLPLPLPLRMLFPKLPYAIRELSTGHLTSPRAIRYLGTALCASAWAKRHLSATAVDPQYNSR